MDLDKISIDRINELYSIDFLSLDKSLLHIIVSIILKINFEKMDKDYSWFEINLEQGKEMVYLNLNSKECLCIEISLFNNNIDMSVGREKEPIYEMYPVNNLLKFKNIIEKWFVNDVLQKFLKSKEDIIFNSFYTKNGELLYKSTNVSCFFKNKKEFEYSNFKSWI